MNDEMLLVQCTERESGGVQCEALLPSLDEPHSHFVSDATIARQLHRPFYTHISLRGVTTYADVF